MFYKSDISNLCVMSDIGSGLNDNRKKLQKLLEMVHVELQDAKEGTQPADKVLKDKSIRFLKINQ